MKKTSPDISREEELLETFTLAAPGGRAGGEGAHCACGVSLQTAEG